MRERWTYRPIKPDRPIVSEVRYVAVTDYVSGGGINNHLYRVAVSVARIGDTFGRTKANST